MGPMFSGKIKHDAQMLRIEVRCLGWCHIMTPAKMKIGDFNRLGEKSRIFSG